MTTSRSPGRDETSLARDLLQLARYYLGKRRVLLILASMMLVAGVGLNWGWLVAAGIAPILISVLPCVAMCALGLCMTKAGNKGCSAEGAAPPLAMLESDASRREDTASLTALPSGRSEIPAAGEHDAHGTDPRRQPTKERNTTDA